MELIEEIKLLSPLQKAVLAVVIVFAGYFLYNPSSLFAAFGPSNIHIDSCLITNAANPKMVVTISIPKLDESVTPIAEEFHPYYYCMTDAGVQYAASPYYSLINIVPGTPTQFQLPFIVGSGTGGKCYFSLQQNSVWTPDSPQTCDVQTLTCPEGYVQCSGSACGSTSIGQTISGVSINCMPAPASPTTTLLDCRTTGCSTGQFCGWPVVPNTVYSCMSCDSYCNSILNGNQIVGVGGFMACSDYCNTCPRSLTNCNDKGQCICDGIGGWTCPAGLTCVVSDTNLTRCGGTYAAFCVLPDQAGVCVNLSISPTECSTDKDCYPSTCCHAKSCSLAQPTCTGIACTMVYEEGQISGCTCVNKECVGVVPTPPTTKATTTIPTTTLIGLPNPASVKCKQDGGVSTIVNGPNGQYGLCTFSNGKVCDEWAYYRGECSKELPITTTITPTTTQISVTTTQPCPIIEPGVWCPLTNYAAYATLCGQSTDANGCLQWDCGGCVSPTTTTTLAGWSSGGVASGPVVVLVAIIAVFIGAIYMAAKEKK